MTSKPDLGGILAICGGGIALAAIVAGFLVIGGPGDARALRLDGMIEDGMQTTAYAVQCAYWIDGKSPASLVDAEATIRAKPAEARDFSCLNTDARLKSRIDYSVIDASHVRLCANFRRPSPKREDGRYRELAYNFPSLKALRLSSGTHCFDIAMQPTFPPGAKNPLIIGF